MVSIVVTWLSFGAILNFADLQLQLICNAPYTIHSQLQGGTDGETGNCKLSEQHAGRHAGKVNSNGVYRYDC